MVSWRGLSLPSLPGGLGGGGAPSKRKSVAGNGRETNALREALRNRGGAAKIVVPAQTDCEDNESLPSARSAHPRKLPTVPVRDDPDDSNAYSSPNIGWLNLEAFAPSAIQKQLERLSKDATVAPSTLMKQADDAISSIKPAPLDSAAAAPPSNQQMAGNPSLLTQIQRQVAPEADRSPPSADTATAEQPPGGFKASSWFAQLAALAPQAAPASTPPTKPATRKSTGGLRSTLAARGGVVRAGYSADGIPMSSAPVQASSDCGEEELMRPSSDLTASLPAVLEDSVLVVPEITEAPPDKGEATVHSIVAPAEAAVEEAVEMPACELADPAQPESGGYDAPGVVQAEVNLSPAVSGRSDSPEQDGRGKSSDACSVAERVLRSSREPPRADRMSLPAKMTDGKSWITQKVEVPIQERKSEPLPRSFNVALAAEDRPDKATSVTAALPPQVIKAKAEAKAKGGQYRDLKEFWNRGSRGFAGPAMGQGNKVSMVEAQATLQRLMSAGAAVDFDHVRRLRKQISEMEATDTAATVT